MPDEKDSRGAYFAQFKTLVFSGLRNASHSKLILGCAVFNDALSAINFDAIDDRVKFIFINFGEF